jgi:hypothetical protein
VQSGLAAVPTGVLVAGAQLLFVQKRQVQCPGHDGGERDVPTSPAFLAHQLVNLPNIPPADAMAEKESGKKAADRKRETMPLEIIKE